MCVVYYNRVTSYKYSILLNKFFYVYLSLGAWSKLQIWGSKNLNLNSYQALFRIARNKNWTICTS